MQATASSTMARYLDFDPPLTHVKRGNGSNVDVAYNCLFGGKKCAKQRALFCHEGKAEPTKSTNQHAFVRCRRLRPPENIIRTTGMYILRFMLKPMVQ
ncbi:hypothetical protein AAHC03_013054 [Spirometra sp. Aus1]